MSTAGENDELDAIAAEFVIGTLNAAERHSFSRRLASNEAAQHAQAAWERRLAPLRHAGELVLPPPELWANIEQAIGAMPTPPLRAIDGRGRESAAMLRSRNRWRALALAASGIAAALVAFVAVRSSEHPQSPGATYVAAVNRGGDKPALIVTVDLRTKTVLVRPVAAPTPTGHSLELWYIGGNRAPRSMGLVTNVGATVAMPKDVAGDATGTFAISLEPPGGSPTGSPTGAVLYSGQLVKE